MRLVSLRPLCILHIVLRSITFCCCQTNSSDNSSSKLEDPFPTLILGKDQTTLWYANVSFGSQNVAQALRVDIGQPYIWLISSVNGSDTGVSLNDGHVYSFEFMDGIDLDGPAVMDTINFTRLSDDDKLQETHTINSSSTVVMTPDYLSISNISFFEANASNFLSKGSLGLGGKITDELAVIDSTKFDSSFFFLDRLTDSGVIASPSYSLWFGADNVPYSLRKLPAGTSADCGKLILGAVDPTLYTGKLRAFDLLPYIDPATQLESRSYPILPLGTIYINSSSGKTLNMTSEEFIEPVLLDSRYSTSYLPTDAIVQIAVQVGATYVESLGRWLVACSVSTYGVQLNFSFDDIAISVPLEDFLVTTYDPQSNSSMHFSNGDEACFLAMVSRSVIGYNILGGPFLKNAYLAFDLEDNAMALAQAKRVSSVSETSVSTSTASVLSSTSTFERQAISSGYIPYAISKNTSQSLTLLQTSVPSGTNNIPDLFTGAIDSDGLISTGRSFYETSRSTTSSKTTETSYSLVISSIVTSTKPGSGTSKNHAAHLLRSTCVIDPRSYFSPQVMAFLAIVLLAVLL